LVLKAAGNFFENFKIKDSTYTVGAIVQSILSKRNFTVAGVPVGIELKDTLNYIIHAPPTSRDKKEMALL
jgi:hypothetical protein